MSTKIPKLCHFKPRDLACVWVSPTRRIYLGAWGSPEAHERYAEVVRRILSGLEVTEAPTLASGATATTMSMLTVRQLAARFLDHARAYYTRGGVPTGEADIIELAVNAAVSKYGDLPASSFGPLALEAVRDGLVDSGLARTTVNGRTRRIIAMFRWGVAKELVPASTHHALTMVSGLRAGRTKAREPEPVQPVPDDIVDATIKHLPEVVADMVRLQRLTAARPGEVCAMRPADIDRTGKVWLYQPAAHKTAFRGKRKTVFIGPQAQAILLRYLARDPETYCFRPCDSEAKRRAQLHAERSTPMSCGNVPGSNVRTGPCRTVGVRYKKDAYARAIARACIVAEVPHWTPNQLRHSAATAVRRDFGLEGAQLVLGHANAKTSEIYAERDMAKGAEIALLIG